MLLVFLILHLRLFLNFSRVSKEQLHLKIKRIIFKSLVISYFLIKQKKWNIIRNSTKILSLSETFKLIVFSNYS